MVKIVKLLFLVLLIASATFGATNYINQLKEYDRLIPIVSDDELLRVHHGLKKIYIYSIVENNENIKKETLKRLIKTSHILKLDASGYEKEFSTIQKNVTSKPKVTKKITPKTSDNKKNIKVGNLTTKSKTISNLNNITIVGNKLELVFDKPLNKKDVKRFFLKSKSSSREVFDIKAVLYKTPKLQIPESLSDLRIAQYKKNILRIVLERKKEFKSTYNIYGNRLDIFFKTKKKTKIKPNILSNKLIKTNKTIVIDAGHGGHDSGAIGSKREYEKNAVLQIALRAGKVLKKRGYRVYFTRTRDKFIKLRDRTSYANKKNADLFLSIHANASKKKSLHGVETFFLSPARSDRSKNVAALENKSDLEEMNYFSKQTFLSVFNREKIIQANKLALDVQQGMLNRLRSKYSNVRDGGVREAPFWVLVGAQMPAILIEVGYISNTMERKRIFNSHYQDLLVKGIADGIDSYFLKNEF
ncbi:N-acetylmuramoyl-L-alanine amidase [Sulfurospirillum sp. 1307]|jgi:N-acetylmuramoyl-L-alanine amidase